PSGHFPCAGGSAIQGSAALERVLEVAGSAARDDPGAADGADSRTGVFDPAIRSPMPIDAAKALAAQPRTGEISWGAKDVLLYHLGIGAGVPATDPRELRYTLESRLHVLPSFATVAGAGSPGVIGGPATPGAAAGLGRPPHGGP